MQRCLDALPSASCSETPPACMGVVDTAPARALCGQLSKALCKGFDTCALQDEAECLGDIASSLPCDQAIGIGTAIDQCLSDLATASCSALAEALPASCSGVVKINQ